MSVHHHSSARASRALSGFLLFLVGLGLTVGLYYVKTRAQTAREAVTSLEREVAAEEQAIAVLRAEIAYLESPTRLAELGASELALGATDAERIVEADALVAAIPLRAVEEASDE